MIPITHASDPAVPLQSLLSVVSVAREIVGSSLYVTGAAFADSVFVTFP
jgi:hypothetical protein